MEELDDPCKKNLKFVLMCGLQLLACHRLQPCSCNYAKEFVMYFYIPILRKLQNTNMKIAHLKQCNYYLLFMQLYCICI